MLSDGYPFIQARYRLASFIQEEGECRVSELFDRRGKGINFSKLQSYIPFKAVVQIPHFTVSINTMLKRKPFYGWIPNIHAKLGTPSSLSTVRYRGSLI